ncbi:hypothetical protein EVAR_41070_1 [Eumeta japonica]|uniref:Retrovirus-related Pol polyprotein from transposon TNT 1-94-like beta-barrel domain-containing protein n=1 Tax=Eumeta variegata TaxID=151549 RepID=A0A4C1XVU3_EUMVA|nr:hypothetical protein EVAR_41070_1 [Eumeta japonica]
MVAKRGCDQQVSEKVFVLNSSELLMNVCWKIFESCKTAKEVWENLRRALDDNGLTRRVGLLKNFVNTTLESNEQSKVKRGPRCCNCNNHGHFAKFCTSAKGNKAEHEKGKKDTGFLAACSGKNSEKWFMDSGASMHVTGNRHWMYNVTEPPWQSVKQQYGGGRRAEAYVSGMVLNGISTFRALSPT